MELLVLIRAVSILVEVVVQVELLKHKLLDQVVLGAVVLVETIQE
jgi:hypothetical protein